MARLSKAQVQRQVRPPRKLKLPPTYGNMGGPGEGMKYTSASATGSLPPLFRTIDNFTGGVATSFKSIDLNAATYQKTSQLAYRINTYVDTLGNYEGGSLSGTEVAASNIQDRVLNLIVPKGSMTDEQYAAIEAVRERAMTANKYPVKIVVTEY